MQMPRTKQVRDEPPVTLDDKPNDLVGQGQDGSWKGQIYKAT